MKLSRNFTVICYLFLLAISNIASSKVTSFTTSKITRRSSSRALSKNKFDFSYIKNILRGWMNVILKGKKSLENKILEVVGCYKPENKPAPAAAPSAPAQQSGYLATIFEKILDGLARGIKFIFNLPSTIMGYVCKYKNTIVEYVSKLFALKKIRKYRMMVENGHRLTLRQLRKYRESWGFLSSITNAVKSAASFVASGVKKIGGGLLQLALKVVGPFFKKHFETIKTVMISLRDLFFGENSFVGRLIKCAGKLSKDLWNSIKSFFNKLKERYQRYTGIWGLGLPYVAMYGIDMLFSAVCDKVVAKDFTETVTKYEAAENAKDAKEETTQGGKLLGNLMNFSLTFRSQFSEKITKALKEQGINNQKKARRF